MLELLGDVAQEGVEVPARLPRQPGHGELDVGPGAVLLQGLQAHGRRRQAGLAGAQEARQCGRVVLAALGRDHQLAHELTERLGLRPAEQARGRGVPLDDAAVVVHAHERIARGVQDGPLAGLALAEPHALQQVAVEGGQRQQPEQGGAAERQPRRPAGARADRTEELVGVHREQQAPGRALDGALGGVLLLRTGPEVRRAGAERGERRGDRGQLPAGLTRAAAGDDFLLVVDDEHAPGPKRDRVADEGSERGRLDRIGPAEDAATGGCLEGDGEGDHRLAAGGGRDHPGDRRCAPDRRAQVRVAAGQVLTDGAGVVGQ